ncbi:MAG: hypothetical protein ACI9U0_000128 [Flavobacteriales bacterium]
MVEIEIKIIKVTALITYIFLHNERILKCNRKIAFLGF